MVIIPPDNTLPALAHPVLDEAQLLGYSAYLFGAYLRTFFIRLIDSFNDICRGEIAAFLVELD